MRPALVALTLVVCAGAIGAGGYLLGRQHPAALSDVPAMAAAATPDRKILYYKDPMGKPEYSPAPKKDSMGMDYIPVYEDQEEKSAPPRSQSAAALGGKGRTLYYRNPMGLPDTSPVPKKDSMGMDYIPVYENEAADDSGAVKISLSKVQKLGVQTEPVQRRTLTRAVRAVGTVQADERRLFIVNTKFDGWIEKLHVNATGQAVRRGEPLMEVYAPELVVVQQEYLLAWRSLQDVSGATREIRASASQLADAALQRLRNWDISDDQIRRLQREGKITRTLMLTSPADGVVLEKMAVAGMRFMAGDPLYRIADLSTVWLIADVYEQDLGAVQVGQNAKIAVNAYPGATFGGKVDFVYPTVMRDTRTGKVRIVIENADGRLKTDMYANVEFGTSAGGGEVLAVPSTAVIDSGARQVVLVERGAGTYEPREVKLGARADDFYEVRKGVTEGERVVVSANFLIDAESNLKAALKAFAQPQTDGERAQ